MGVLFGTDGIRGVAGEPPLDRDDVYRIGYCLTRHLSSAKAHPRLLIGRDTRVSGPWIEALLRHAIEDAGGTAEICGVLSTPAVSLLTQKTSAQAGIMISASHNPFQDNGIKIFSAEGMKFTDGVEAELERAILACGISAPNGFSRDPSSAPFHLTAALQYQNLYTAYLRAALPSNFTLAGMPIVVDCAHGSLSQIASRSAPAGGLRSESRHRHRL